MSLLFLLVLLGVLCYMGKILKSGRGRYLFFFFLKIGPFLFIYLFISGCDGSSLLHRPSLVAEKGGCSWVVLHRLLSALASLGVGHGL